MATRLIVLLRRWSVVDYCSVAERDGQEWQHVEQSVLEMSDQLLTQQTKKCVRASV